MGSTRGKRRSSGGTLARIVRAATVEFAEKGFDGARVEAIAKRAGVNKAALYYHVGNKKALYERVILNVVGAAAVRLDEKLSGTSRADEMLRTYVRVLIQTFDEHPEMPRIIMREMASGGSHLPEAFLKGVSGILDRLAKILDAGRKEGVFEEVMPLVVHLMVVGAAAISRHMPARLKSMLRAASHLGGSGEERLMGEVAGEIERLVIKAVSASKARPGG